MPARALLLASLPIAILLATPSHARDWEAEASARYQACLKLAAADPEGALEEGLIWRSEAGGAPARHCIAIALLNKGEQEEAAAQLEHTALMPDAGEDIQRAELLAQAGNIWLLARAPAEAERAFTSALNIAPNDADIYIDRARAHDLLGQLPDAVSDLSTAIALSPANSLALRLRADAHIRQGRLDAAGSDVTAAINSAVTEEDTIEALVVRGRLNEAKRVAAGGDDTNGGGWTSGG